MINAATGRPSAVADAVKLRQDLQEFFSIEVLSNGFGAGVDQLIGMVEVSSDMFVSLIDRQIRDGIESFRMLQNAESRISRLPEERLLAMTYLIVEKDQTDPTKYWFRANFVTNKGVEVPFT